ncbi:4-diphosphocytidyl-2-C-methyl-D-erythritol kinase [Mangrovibacterium marinum]|uniref:4-diphosphocytidyl-2-C-methyl-D-erythritol kinase n=1 Tax=Mangrovibacterium marinum TaxID=1639118 RepID=A0A2T5C1A7_9BACT|nr:4-(cytidine 5'-diphospho)-2-C-methyl-D-erythritol kinase [Mangrovibacterium marinum]PTN08392.1 4-diphosphocytidyl-2-C-methyl-D-erythritol kinase [Mangrovibacterium marinum]
MITYPIAKVNLGLLVTEKRPDGFHNLETIFYPIQMQDTLEVVESDQFQFSSSGIAIDGKPDDNLVVKAFRLIKDDYGIPDVKIHLHKTIPSGAGLGGGSSDAAYTLRSLNELFKLEIEGEKLMEYALQLGSDCPFFLQDKPVFATGRGEKMVEIPLTLKEYYLILVKPPVHVSTALAYQNIVPQKPRLSLRGLVGFPVNKWKGNVLNHFEKYVFQAYPEVEQIKQTLYEQGATFALMSGSGSAVYGLFRSEKRGIEKLFPEDYQVFRQRL